jgi:hypothetical protein
VHGGKREESLFDKLFNWIVIFATLQSAIFMLSSLLMGNRFDRIILPRADKIAQGLIIDLSGRGKEERQK